MIIIGGIDQPSISPEDCYDRRSISVLLEQYVTLMAKSHPSSLT